MPRLSQSIWQDNRDREDPNPASCANQRWFESPHGPTYGRTHEKTGENLESREVDPWQVIAAESISGKQCSQRNAGEERRRVRKRQLGKIAEYLA